MMRRNLLVSTVLSAGLFCSVVTLAQAPVQNINKNKHPNLAEAQRHVVEADNSMVNAQKDNRYDMHGHAKNARQLLVQASQEMKLAAEDADAAEYQRK